MRIATFADGDPNFSDYVQHQPVPHPARGGGGLFAPPSMNLPPNSGVFRPVVYPGPAGAVILPPHLNNSFPSNPSGSLSGNPFSFGGAPANSSSAGVSLFGSASAHSNNPLPVSGGLFAPPRYSAAPFRRLGEVPLPQPPQNRFSEAD